MFSNRTSRSTIDQLKSISLFSGCSDKELERIDRLTYPKEMAAGTVLCREGCVGRQTFVVVSGQAQVCVSGVEVAVLGPGSFVGEMSVLDGNFRVATVTALTPMTVLVLSAQELHGLVLEVPPVGRRMLAAMAGRLRPADRALATRSSTG